MMRSVLVIACMTATSLAAHKVSTPPPAMSLDAAVTAAADLPRLHSLLVSWRGGLILERH